MAAALLVLPFAGSVAMAQQPAPAAAVVPSVSLQPPADAPPIKEIPPGPYAVEIEANAGLPTHTIYRPSDLTTFKGRKALPIVSWGNGACANTGTLFKTFLSQVASHGYLVISIGPKDAPLPAFATGGATSGDAAPAASPQPMAMSRDQQLLDAIDWALAENARQESPYHQRLDPQRIAVMGQSCGGLQTIAVSSDPRIKTSVIWNSGVLPANMGSVGARFSGATKESLAKLHAPVAYFVGGPADLAYAYAEDDFQRITGVPVFKGSLNVGHGGTFRHPGAGWFGEVGVAWLDWQLKGDKRAAKYFTGAECVLCTNPIWTVARKGIK